MSDAADGAAPFWTVETARRDYELGGPGETREGAALALAASAWSEAEKRATELIRGATGKSVAEHVLAALSAALAGRMLALGAGAGALAIELLQQVRDVELLCLAGETDWLPAARRRACELAARVDVAAADLETAVLEPYGFDVIFCHAALYRVFDLDRIADQIRRSLRPNGLLVIVDLATRPGLEMRPQTREVVRGIWQTLPARFRLNHTAYAAPLIDDVIWEPQPPPADAKIPSPERIPVVIGRRFRSEHFVPYFSLSRRFFDSMYGPNYDLSAPLDRAVFDWIWQLDRHYLSTGRLQPETFFGLYRAR